MTQTAVNYTAMSKADLIAVIENQKLTINFERQKRIWLEDVISNSDLPFNTRLAVIATKKLEETTKPGDNGFYRAHLPRLADIVGVSASTISRGLKRLADETEAIEHKTEHDALEPYKQIVYIKPTEKLEHPKDIRPVKEVARHGGARVVARCNGCGSENIVEKRVQVCADCGTVYKEFEPRQVNTPLQDATGESSQLFVEPLQDATYTVDTRVSDCNVLSAHLELQSISQWVVWRAEERDGKLTKVPYNAQLGALGKADVSKPTTWASYEQAQATYERSQSWARPYSGVGFVFHHNGIVGIDQDKSLQPLIDSYTELSVSETGLHIFARGTIPSGRRRNGTEMYDTGRFFAWTGKHVPGTPNEIMDCQEAIDALYQELAPAAPAPTSDKFLYHVPCSNSDETILEKARGAANGAKFTALYSGDTSGYSSPSEADLALCRMLAYWSDSNVSTIRRLFEESGLMRDKWYRNVGAGETYGERTIARAIGEQERRAS